jgi:Protein of unknown function (DUF4232)
MHPSPTAPSPGRPPCKANQLHANGLLGGAYQGHEVAGVLFVNTSHATCTLQGYVFAQLRYHHKKLGRPAQDNRGATRRVTMRSGDSAEVQLTAVSTCQAPISDHALVRVPGDDTPIMVAMQLRGCTLSVGPITPA